MIIPNNTADAGHLDEIVACFDTIKAQAEMLKQQRAQIDLLTEQRDNLIIANRKLAYKLHGVDNGTL